MASNGRLFSCSPKAVSTAPQFLVNVRLIVPNESALAGAVGESSAHARGPDCCGRFGPQARPGRDCPDDPYWKPAEVRAVLADDHDHRDDIDGEIRGEVDQTEQARDAEAPRFGLASVAA
jgi:hypothetical protein